MVVAKCPLRISLVGGGTDLQEFIDYNVYGSVISFPCNLYSYITLFSDKNGINAVDEKYVVKYTKQERHSCYEDIQNDIARVCLKYFRLPHCQISFHSDISSHGSGLASSSAYVISAIEAIRAYYNINLTRSELCALALKLEREFNPLTGMQDIYGCGFGSFKKLEFHKDNRVRVRMFHGSLIDDYDKYLIHTGVSRSSTKILNSVDVKKLQGLLPLVKQFEKTITLKDSDVFFEVINEGWSKKKESSPLIADNGDIKAIDEKLSASKEIKAHKLCGAGGGGYFLVFVEKGFSLKKSIPEFSNNCFKIQVDGKGVRSKKV